MEDLFVNHGLGDNYFKEHGYPRNILDPHGGTQYAYPFENHSLIYQLGLGYMFSEDLEWLVSYSQSRGEISGFNCLQGNDKDFCHFQHTDEEYEHGEFVNLDLNYSTFSSFVRLYSPLPILSFHVGPCWSIGKLERRVKEGYGLPYSTQFKRFGGLVGTQLGYPFKGGLTARVGIDYQVYPRGVEVGPFENQDQQHISPKPYEVFPNTILKINSLSFTFGLEYRFALPK